MKLVIDIDFDGAKVTIGNLSSRFIYESSKSGFKEAKYQGSKVSLSARDTQRLESLIKDCLDCHHLSIGQSDESPTSRVPLNGGDVVVDGLLTRPHLGFINESTEVPIDSRVGSMEPIEK